jgi:hypothetical protein
MKQGKGKQGESEKHAGGRPPKFATPELLQSAIDEYFESCWVDKVTETTDSDGKCVMSEVRYQQRPYTIAGLAYHLEMTTQALRNYEAKDEFLGIIKRAKQKVEMNIEEQLIAGKSAAGPIFWLKNHAGYADTQKMELSGTDGKPIEHKHDISDDMLAAIAAGANG